MRARSTIFTLFAEYFYPERHAPLKAIIAMMAALGFSEAAVRAALSRSAKRGWVVAERRGRVACYALSERVDWQVRQVRRRLYEPLPPWDGTFLLVLPEGPKARGERERFKREMALLGYGSLQSGLYLGASADLKATQELLAFYGLPATFFRGRHLGSREEVLRAFALEEAESKYRSLGLAPPHPQDPLEAFQALTRLVHEMRKILFLDPLLPAELLPEGFPGLTARKRFLEVRAVLYQRASPFLREIGLPLSALSPGAR